MTEDILIGALQVLNFVLAFTGVSCVIVSVLLWKWKRLLERKVQEEVDRMLSPSQFGYLRCENCGNLYTPEGQKEASGLSLCKDCLIRKPEGR